MYLDDPVDLDTRLGQYPHNVLTALLRLVRNAALDQIALGIGGDLAGDIDLRAGDDGLGLVKISAYILPMLQSPQLSVVVRGRGIAMRGKPREEARLSIEGMMRTYIRSSSYTHRQHSSLSAPSNPIARKLTRTRILSKHLLDLRHIALLLQLQDTRYDKGSRS
jgi:hypothetical protein